MSRARASSRAGAAAAALLGLAGCALLPSPGPPAVPVAQRWQEHHARLAQLVRWRLVGRLGVRVGGRAWSAGMRWQAAPESYALSLSGPLGRGALRIDGGPGGVRVRDGEGHEYQGADPDALAARLLGWPLPVTALSWWVRGLPAPGLPLDELELDAEGRVRRLVQDGWQVEVGGYVRSAGVDVPARLQVRLPSRRIDVRLAIREWVFG